MTEGLRLGDPLREDIEFLPPADQGPGLQEGVGMGDIGLRRWRDVPDGYGRHGTHTAVSRLLHGVGRRQQGAGGHVQGLRQGSEGTAL
jgi:hypothetical protein